MEKTRPKLEQRIAAGNFPALAAVGLQRRRPAAAHRGTQQYRRPGTAFPPLWRGERYGHDRIRVGYISGDFRKHVVGSQIAELIERHDRTRFEIFGLATTGDDGSETRARLMRGFDQFHDLSAMDHLGAPLMCAGWRSTCWWIWPAIPKARISACWPSALRRCGFTWLGYPGTTGADFLDGLIADKVVAPDAAEFSEPLVYMPGSFFVSDTSRRIGPTPSRAEAGLPEQGFVFCSFNSNWKITAPVFAIWMRLLEQMEASVLWLRQSGGGADANLKQAAAGHGIDPARIIFAPHVSDAEHLARHACADLFLDTLPYNAHATACDALWTGLPVLTRRGNAFAGRVAASLLTASGMGELITESQDDYEALALALAREPARLKALRARLAANRGTMPLFDTPAFARDLERLFGSLL